MSSNGVSGLMSPSIGALSWLELLHLNDNDIKATIPAEIGALTNLTSLKLDHNSLRGAIPASFRDLKNLVLIQPQSNLLEGTIAHVTVHGKENNNSFISDCGVPSKFLEPIVCEACTMCCNLNNECHIRDLPTLKSYRWAWGFFLILLLDWFLIFGFLSIFQRGNAATEMEEVVNKTGTNSIDSLVTFF